MHDQKSREKRILAKLNLDKLPYELKEGSFKGLGARISNFIHQVFLMQQNTRSINWCFANIKKAKIFFLAILDKNFFLLILMYLVLEFKIFFLIFSLS